MESIIRVKYYVGVDRSEWTVTEARHVNMDGTNISYVIDFDTYKANELLLDSFKIIPDECLQDKNINRKDFNLCFYLDCYAKDLDTAKAKLKGRVILLLTKHQNKIDKLMSNL